MLPGKKSPSRGNAELGGREAEAERCWDRNEVAGAKSKVATSSPTITGVPHDEQKRPLLATSTPQALQVDMNLPKTVYRVGGTTADSRFKGLPP